jgi:hypothetical protein
MSATLEQAAIEAIYHRQLNTERAVRYVTTQTGVGAEQAMTALRQVMTVRK